MRSNLNSTKYVPVRQSVLPGILQRQCACGEHTAGGECDECKKKEMIVQRQSNGAAGPAKAPALVSDVLASGGRPLDYRLRSQMEPQFGHDFSGVRVHTDAKAAESARAMNALAYTVGNHIAFQPGFYNPASEGGQYLLAHELTHVVQNRNSGSSSHGFSQHISHPGDASEREASQVARAVISNHKPQVSQPAHAMVHRIDTMEV